MKRSTSVRIHAPTFNTVAVETSEVKSDTWTIPVLNHKIMTGYIFSNGVRSGAVA
jgi:hypothetical protein